ncbi:MAG TPA: hypothetical protein VGF79_04640 [Bacteroidia bacterium]
MKREIKHTEEFDLYLKNKLSVEDKAAFENKLANDSELAQEFEFYQLMVEGIKESERRALKAHIQANKGNMFWGQNIWPKKMTYAAAAVIALFVGLYVVIKQQDLTPEKSVAITEKQAPIENQPWTTELGTDTSKTASPKDIAANKQSSSEVEFEHPALEELPVNIEMEDVNGLIESPVAAAETYNDYDGIKDQETVLSEIKLQDTTFLLAHLIKPEIVSDLMLSNQVETTRAYKYKHLPKNENNQAPASKEAKKQSKYYSDTNVRTDATVFTKNKSGSTEKTATQMNVEFWKSPVNFRGFSYDNKVLKLYGVDQNAIRYYFVNNKIYLRMDGTVYEVKFCPESCPFISINDNEMMIYILNLP